MDLAADRDDELQDLSPQDAEEIRAFLEKRRWFEGKLKILESLPPIYPFLHPSLETTTDEDHEEEDSFRRIGAADAQWSLPALDQLREWQRERDALEEEVLAFDGGDLGRMKDTTRAATLLPLTPPSTHLVSITLALIVLIDRLLTLLRQRSDLLELTALRLTWDTLRWQVMQESRRIRNEIDGIITNKGRWVPPDAKSIIPRASSGSLRASAMSPSGDACASKEVLRTPETRPVALPRPTNGHKTLDPPDSPISPRAAAPRRSLALPILHSQITNLQIRHRNLASTALSRSGAILDKIIDHAGPLRNLGGVNGPTTDVKEGGAVPDELLDIQDELEGDCEKVRALVEWCKQLEQQWNSADEHYAASIKARHSALDVISRLQSALDEPATSEQHLQLSSLLATAQSTLPEEISERFPRPSHPAYPANDEHNSHVVDTLRVARRDASADLKLATEALAWYERLSAARTAVLQQLDNVNDMESALSDARDRVLTGTAAVPRPVIDASEPSHPVPDWIASAQSSTAEGKQLCSQATTLIHHTTVANMRYRQLLRAAPNNLLEVVPALHHDVSDAAEVATGNLLELVQSIHAAVNIAEQDAELWPMVITFDSSAASLATKVDRLYATLASAVDEGAWAKSKNSAKRGDDLPSAVSELGQEITRDVEEPHRAIEALLRKFERDTPLLQNRLAKTAEALRYRHKSLCRLADLAQRVRAQATIVRLIQQEADEMISSITRAQARLERPIGNSDPEVRPSIQELRTPVEISQSLEELEMRAREWESALANRVPLVASTNHTDARDGASPALLSPNSTAADPPMTPPATPPPFSPDIQVDPVQVGSQHGPKLDLTFLDREVRQEINETAAKVSTALCTARVAGKTCLLNQWKAGADDAEQNVRAIVAEASQSLQEAQAKRGLINAGARSGSIEDLQSCLDLAEDLREIGMALTLRFHAKLDGAIGVLDDWTGDAVVGMVSGVDQRDLETYAETRRNASALQSKLSRFEAEAQALVATLHAQLAQSQAAVAQTEPVPADVFGSRLPRPPSSRKTRRSKSPVSGAPDLDAILRLRKRIDSLRIGELVSPSTSVLQSTPGSRKLPTESVSRRVRAEVNAVAVAAHSIGPASTDKAAYAMEELREAINAAEQDLPLLAQLSELSAKIQNCDTALSQIIDALDHGAGGELDDMFQTTERAYDTVTSHARPLQSDRRVASEMRRLEVAFDELKALRSGAPEVDFDDAASDTTSIAYGSVSSRLTLHPNRSSLSVRSGASARSASNPVASHRPALPQVEPRSRTVSETPARARLNSTLPRSRVDSMVERPSSIPRPVRLSQAPNTHATNASTSSNTLSATPRSRKTSMLPVKTPNKPVKAYVPHPKSKLDLAVGRVVNKLKVNVPVVPVGMGEKDEWKDQTGRYWIGAEGRAKLYFCRILRSKTVMVRVGGGWVELSKFLLDHFADALWDTPFTAASVPGTPLEPIGSSKPVTITSASLNAPAITPGKPRSRLSSAVTAATPPPLPTPTGPSTPTQYISQSPVSPSASASPNKSPLVPLHFIRKASESPPVREREKAKYKIGKRSILGKEPSWSEPQEH